MTFRGRVVKERASVGSKSEHDAVILRTDEPPDWFVLRLPGGNPFSDPRLEALVGKTIAGEGEVSGKNLYVKAWREEAC